MDVEAAGDDAGGCASSGTPKPRKAATPCADLLAPTQQLVRPLLVIVDAGTPVAAAEEG
ncbi:hypothetical protein JDV09_10605 [Mycobacterium sp. Y57]|uniref:hypothetical protein n=1 Tax=Mycolicibacterium xanthum TaxID=2796469 RepID=UPI001C85DEBA|nr:hypothetical protein [Mycolicibacterium xanthum]MBX7432550.1 hypothetical protein [Mycolicibacterium xanthum]